MSAEQFVVESKYNSRTIVKNSYEEVLQYIADDSDSETLAAVVDVNVARFITDLSAPNAHYHKHKLAIVEEIHQDLPLYMLAPKRLRYWLFDEEEDSQSEKKFESVRSSLCLDEFIKMDKKSSKKCDGSPPLNA